MMFLKGILSQLKDLSSTLWKLYFPVVLIFGGIIFLRLFHNIPVGYITRDPGDIMRHCPVHKLPFCVNGIVDLPVFIGGLSNLGILLWCSTVAVCFFCYVVGCSQRTDTGERGLILFAGVISGLLLTDDLFRLHEYVFPKYLHLHEYVLYAIYAVLMLFFITRYWSTICKTDYLLFLFALVGFGLSIGSDVLTDMFFRRISGAMLFEDGAKFFGIVSWFGYFSRICLKQMVRSQSEVKDDDSVRI